MFLLNDLSFHDACFVLSSLVNVDGLDVVNPSFVHVKSVRADVSPIEASATLPSSSLQAPNGVLSEPVVFPEKMVAIAEVFPSDAHVSNVVFSPKTLPLEEQASINEWAPWHEDFGALKNEFKNGERMLNSIKELLPQGQTFISRIDFRGVMVHSGLLDVLCMFFKKVGDTNKNLRHLSP
ncbi:hypothetical protein D8674_017373 [Pyrus ussuriensis x Pyrus communis]|uniref:Uncharacterized protein n=1 Tax=Pyrus ussuriensis x Pyrus communis TaxID=2448454 RepID=A0A5N5HGJ2_9ROSA|nr:hypothetical protein D8674_017373 [Pyrus ussuriensis x Pyrus communis]